LFRGPDGLQELTAAARSRALDALEVGVIVHDSALGLVYANAAAAVLLGVDVAEAIERTVSDPRWVVIHPDGSPVAHEDVPASVALRTRKPVRGMILGVTHRDGVTAWLAVDAVPLLGARGDVELVAVTISDVTRMLVARMQLEQVGDSLGRTIQERDAALSRAVQALESSEARYRAVIRAMSEGVAVHAPDGSISFANPAAEQILGLTLAQMQGKHPIAPSWHLTDAVGVPLPAERIPSEITRRTGEPQRSTQLGVMRANSGEHAWLLVSTDPIGPATEPKNDGRYSVVATFQDVTAERRALADAEQARDHLRAVAAALPGVIVEYVLPPDGSGRFLYVSAPARSYFGIDPDEALKDAVPVWRRVHPEDRESILTHMRAVIATRAALQLDFRILHPDGTYRHARVHYGPPGSLPEGTLFRGVVFDITEQKRLEETVREAQRREAMGTLAAGMAHNFNNMLAVILPSLEMVRDEMPPSRQEDLEDACTAATAAAELVRQLMQLVRKDVATDAVRVDVAALVDDISQMCRRTFSAGIEVRSTIPPEPCMVLARRAELQQVLVNLCINAKDALEGRPAPRLELRVTVEPDFLVVEVVDNGAGMSPEVLRRLGEPFFTTKAPGRGTGLGLATAYGIVTDLRGTLRCRSELGSGTSFELRLPLHRYHDTPSATETAPLRVPERLHALIIDDEELVQNTLRRAIERAGAKVSCASTGEEGLATFRAHPGIGLVLLDLAMPGLGGAEVLRRLKAIDPSVAAYVMTGFLPDGLDLKLANGIVTKPIDMKHLHAIINEVATHSS
jgi:PAS domain S-box-containing protein